MLLPHPPLFAGEHALPCPRALVGPGTWLPLLRTPLRGALVPLRRLRGSWLALLGGLLPRARLLLPLTFLSGPLAPLRRPVRLRLPILSFLRFPFLAFLLLLPGLGLLRPLPLLPLSRSSGNGGTSSPGKKKRNRRAHHFNASHLLCLDFFVLRRRRVDEPKAAFLPGGWPRRHMGLCPASVFHPSPTGAHADESFTRLRVMGSNVLEGKFASPVPCAIGTGRQIAPPGNTHDPEEKRSICHAKPRRKR